VTWGTTDFFLEHFGLPSLDDLPGHEEMSAAGLLDRARSPPYSGRRSPTCRSSRRKTRRPSRSRSKSRDASVAASRAAIRP
jgi:hypothetical protein